METIIIKPKTKKQAAAIIDFAKQNGLTAQVVTTNKGLSKPAIAKKPKTKTFTAKEIVFLQTIRRTAKHAREIEAGIRRSNSLKNLMNEL